MMSKSDRGPHSVIAAVKDDARFKAVEVRKQDNVVEVLWTRSQPADGQTWTTFAAACGVTPGRDGHDGTQKRHTASVVGLDATAVAFYRLTAPAVDPQEMGSIVRMQAESLLPLPPDQIEVAWRTTPSTNGNVDVTIAAARTEYLQKFAGGVRDFHPGGIVLSCEGTAKAWQSLFSDRQREGTPRAISRVGESQAVLVSITQDKAQVCLVQNGLVTQAAVLATGSADLMAPGEDSAATLRAETMEWFAQELRTALGSFGWDESKPWPVVVLSDGGEAMDRLVESLNAADLPAQVSVPETRSVRLPSNFKTEDIYEYRTALGLSLMALERPSGALNLFERIAAQEEQAKTTSAWRSVYTAGAVAAAVLIVLLVACYLTDVTAAKRWTELVNRPDFEAARRHQAMLKTVARYRPDLLDLLAQVNSGQNDGVALDSLQFRKGQAVSITGQAAKMEQLWKFEANLRAQKAKGIDAVTIANQSADAKSKKIKFTITFNYKNFSRKDAVL